MTRPPTAAQALYGHLKSGVRDVVERRDQPASVADALYAHLKPPQPAPNRYRQSTDVSLAQRCDEDPWLEHQLALSGLVRKR